MLGAIDAEHGTTRRGGSEVFGGCIGGETENARNESTPTAYLVPERSEDRTALARRELGEPNALSPTATLEHRILRGANVLDPRKSFACHEISRVVQQDKRHGCAAGPSTASPSDR